MRKNDKKIFLDKVKLTQLLNLRLNGFALTSLAYLFNCDVMSVWHQCKKYQIEPLEDVYTIERIIKAVIPKPQPLTYRVINGEKINIGKNYADYILMEKSF